MQTVRMVFFKFNDKPCWAWEEKYSNNSKTSYKVHLEEWDGKDYVEFSTVRMNLEDWVKHIFSYGISKYFLRDIMEDAPLLVVEINAPEGTYLFNMFFNTIS